MSASLPPKTPAINVWLRDAAEQLASAGIPSALLDAEVLIENLGERREAIGRAAGVRDELVLGLQLVFVDAQHAGEVGR